MAAQYLFSSGNADSAIAELNELLWALPSSLDPHQIVGVLLEKGARLFDVPLIGVWFRSGAHFEPAGIYGFTEKKAEQLWSRLGLAERPAALYALDGQALHALTAFGKRRLGALLAAPLIAADSMVGWLVLARFEPRPFSEIEQQFVAVVAARVAGAIANARLFQETELKSRELELLYEIAQLLVSTIRLDELLERLVTRMTETFDLTGCAVRLIDPEAQTIPMRAIYHRDPDTLARLKAYFPTHVPRLGHGRAGMVLKLREPYVTRNLAEDPILDPDDRAALGVGSLAAVPLIVRGHAIGVMFWFRAGRQHPLTEAIVPIATHLAAQVAVAIEHAQLYQEMEARVEARTALLRESNQRLAIQIAEGRARISRYGEALRSQLHNVIGYAGLVESGLPRGSAEAGYLDKLSQSAEEVNALVEDLMGWLKSEGGEGA